MKTYKYVYDLDKEESLVIRGPFGQEMYIRTNSDGTFSITGKSVLKNVDPETWISPEDWIKKFKK